MNLIYGPRYLKVSFSGGASDKEPSRQCRRPKRCEFNPWVRKIPWRRKCQPTPVLLPGKSNGRKSLVGYSPWGSEKSGMAEHTILTFLHCRLALYHRATRESLMEYYTAINMSDSMLLTTAWDL